jgi:hypothetical protein
MQYLHAAEVRDLKLSFCYMLIELGFDKLAN